MKAIVKSMLKFICPYGLVQLRKKLKTNGVLKQELLLRQALREKGFDLDRLSIIIDHDLGINYVNSVEMGIKYPDSFYEACSQLLPKNKGLDYYFKGEMHDSGLRKMMLEPYMSLDGERSIVIESNNGRIIDKKDKFDDEYFKGLADAKFGLCPDQADINHTASHLWGYRFIDSCFTNAIPILFVIAPLSYRFTHDFNVYWHTKKGDVDSFLYNEEKAEFNRKLAKERFLLTDEECEKIKKSIK